jgi:hypothetical protein
MRRLSLRAWVGSFRYGSLCAMSPPSGANRLDPFEAWASARLEPILGPLRKIDPGGGPHAVHDFEADLPNGSVAAIEVTSEVDLRRRRLEAAAQESFPTFTVPGSAFLWVVALAAHAKVKKLRREDLHWLVNDLEAAGRQRVLDIGDYRDPFVARLAALGSSRSTRSRRSPEARARCWCAPAPTSVEGGTDRPRTSGSASCWSPTGVATSSVSLLASPPPSGISSSSWMPSARPVWASPLR